MPGLVAAICALFGVVIGSFLNVVIWRLPRKESLAQPPSHCPGCDAPISPRDNIPVLSWLALRGRCRHCQVGISARYPAVELLTGALFGGVGAVMHDSWALPAFLIFTAALVAITFIDLEHFKIPNKIVYPVGFVTIPMLGLASILEEDVGAFGRALIVGVISFVVFLVIHLASPRGMGFGDVKLSFLLGVFLGYLGGWHAGLGLFAGFLYGSVIGVALIAFGRRGRKQHIPFGPFLAAGAMTFFLFGDPIVDWYQGFGT